MVCTGNICRSPMAEGILSAKAVASGWNLHVDSAGTGGWHEGENPDRRAIAAAHRHGIDISSLVARKFTRNDFRRFDRIYVMDIANYRDVIMLAGNAYERGKVEMLLNLVYPGENRSVPDPYRGSNEDFNHVFRLLDLACGLCSP